MKLIIEDLNTLSIQAKTFIKKHPELESKINAFENTFEIGDSIENSEYLLDILNDEKPSMPEEIPYGEDGAIFIDYQSITKPEYEDVSYEIENGKLMLKGWLVYSVGASKCDQYNYGHRPDEGAWKYQNDDAKVWITYWFGITFPEDEKQLEDIDAYKIEMEIVDECY